MMTRPSIVRPQSGGRHSGGEPDDYSRGYVAVAGSERRPARGAKWVADTDPAEMFSATIRVRRQPDGPPIRGLDDWAKIPLNQREFLYCEEFAAALGASPEDLANVAAFADPGLAVTGQGAGQHNVAVSGTVQQMETAFAVKLGRSELPTETYRGCEASVDVPTTLGEIVESVLGLDNCSAVCPRFKSTLGGPAWRSTRRQSRCTPAACGRAGRQSGWRLAHAAAGGGTVLLPHQHGGLAETYPGAPARPKTVPAVNRFAGIERRHEWGSSARFIRGGRWSALTAATAHLIFSLRTCGPRGLYATRRLGLSRDHGRARKR